jgi:transcriptional regulator with XRE-family HTH domain
MGDLASGVKGIRKSRGWSQEKLAQLAKTSTRTITRIESGVVEPRPDTLEAIALAFGVDEPTLRLGLSAEQITDVLDQFVCPHCGAQLAHRHFVPNEYGDDEVDAFECGHMRGYINRPCPKDPRFPSFEDYALEFRQDADGLWHCCARALTEYARRVSLVMGRGCTREQAAKWTERSYRDARYGHADAEKFLPVMEAIAACHRD